jgi:uncharacterized protein (UPF0371 family)
VAAARQEIIRRYYAARCDLRKGYGGEAAVQKIELIMKQAGISESDRPVVAAAKARAEETALPAVAIELPDGRIVTGKTSDLLGPSRPRRCSTPSRASAGCRRRPISSPAASSSRCSA